MPRAKTPTMQQLEEEFAKTVMPEVDDIPPTTEETAEAERLAQAATKDPEILRKAMNTAVQQVKEAKQPEMVELSIKIWNASGVITSAWLAQTHKTPREKPNQVYAMMHTLRTGKGKEEFITFRKSEFQKLVDLLEIKQRQQ